MRTMMNRIRRNIFVLMLALGIPFVARAQHFPDELNFKLDWQVNAPVGYDYADKLSGWGMNFEVAYEVSERCRSVLLLPSIRTTDMRGAKQSSSRRPRR